MSFNYIHEDQQLHSKVYYTLEKGRRSYIQEDELKKFESNSVAKVPGDHSLTKKTIFKFEGFAAISPMLLPITWKRYEYSLEDVNLAYDKIEACYVWQIAALMLCGKYELDSASQGVKPTFQSLFSFLFISRKQIFDIFVASQRHMIKNFPKIDAEILKNAIATDKKALEEKNTLIAGDDGKDDEQKQITDTKYNTTKTWLLTQSDGQQTIDTTTPYKYITPNTNESVLCKERSDHKPLLPRIYVENSIFELAKKLISEREPSFMYSVIYPRAFPFKDILLVPIQFDEDNNLVYMVRAIKKTTYDEILYKPRACPVTLPIIVYVNDEKEEKQRDKHQQTIVKMEICEENHTMGDEDEKHNDDTKADKNNIGGIEGTTEYVLTHEACFFASMSDKMIKIEEEPTLKMKKMRQKIDRQSQKFINDIMVIINPPAETAPKKKKKPRQRKPRGTSSKTSTEEKSSEATISKKSTGTKSKNSVAKATGDYSVTKAPGDKLSEGKSNNALIDPSATEQVKSDSELVETPKRPYRKRKDTVESIKANSSQNPKKKRVKSKKQQFQQILVEDL